RQHAKLICLLAAVALVFGYMGFQSQRLEAQNQPKADKTAVAVVNVAELIAKCQKNKDFQAEVSKRRVVLEKEQKDRQQAINVLRQDLDLAANAAERQKTEREITKALYEFQAWQNIEQQNLLREQRLFLIELYGEIDDAVAMIASKQGYDLVLFDTPAPDFDNLNPEQLVQVIGNRRVVYRAEKVNLTPIVLEKLNLDHLSRGGE
ncbi:MAG: OmpH family outer membrane protein, partial [Planctomycetota bacterium]